MVALQSVVLEHRAKLAKLEKVLASAAEDEELAAQQDINLDEIQRLRDALRESMIGHQNQLKFLIN